MKYRFSLFIFVLLVSSLAADAQLMNIRTIAGNGEQGFDGDGNSAAAATLSGPLGVTLDGAGNIYIQDFYNFRVRKVNKAGVITTVAGIGVQGNSGNGSIGSSASITPYGIVSDKAGNLFISDATYSVIRKVNTLGIISVFAGGKKYGYDGDGGPATAAVFASPRGLALDTAGNLYIADPAAHVVRMISKAGIVSTVAGMNDSVGYFGDGGFATQAKLDSPFAVAVDRSGNLFISDHNNDVIRKVDANNIISTYAGVYNVHNYFGDGGPATAANLNAPQGLAVDTIGNLYIADAENNVIRKVDTAGNISTVVGNGTLGFDGDYGPALGCNMHNPYAIALDSYGDIFIADANNQRIRVAYNATLAVAPVNAVSAIQSYPNPFSDEVTISGLAPKSKVGIYDVLGRPVSAVYEVANGGRQTITVNNLATGLYMLQVWDSNGNKTAVSKLLKN